MMWTYIITRREKRKKKNHNNKSKRDIEKKKEGTDVGWENEKGKKLQGQFWFKKIHLMCIDTAEKL